MLPLLSATLPSAPNPQGCLEDLCLAAQCFINQPLGPYPACSSPSGLRDSLRTRCRDSNLTGQGPEPKPAPPLPGTRAAPLPTQPSPPKVLCRQSLVSRTTSPDAVSFFYPACQALTFHHLPCPHDVHTSVPFICTLCCLLTGLPALPRPLSAQQLVRPPHLSQGMASPAQSPPWLPTHLGVKVPNNRSLPALCPTYPPPAPIPLAPWVTLEQYCKLWPWPYQATTI